MIGIIATVLGFGAMTIDSLETGGEIQRNRKQALEAAKTKPWVVAYPIDKGNYIYLETGETVYKSDGWLRNPKTGQNIIHLPSLAWKETEKYLRNEAKEKGLAGYPFYSCESFMQKICYSPIYHGAGNLNFEIDNKFSYYIIERCKEYGKEWKDDDVFAIMCCSKNYNMLLHPEQFSPKDIFNKENCWTVTFTYKDRDKLKKYDTTNVLTPNMKTELSYLYHEIMDQRW